MVKNPRKTRYGEDILFGTPHHVDVVFRPGNRIWYSEVNDQKGNLLDKTENRRMDTIIECYAEDFGNRPDAIRSGIEIGKHHGIPVHIISGTRIVKTIKPMEDLF
jgi:hypothetical protein